MAGLSPFTVMTNIFISEFSETFRKNSTVSVWNISSSTSCHICTLNIIKIYFIGILETENLFLLKHYILLRPSEYVPNGVYQLRMYFKEVE